jgi:hypothetical protein
MRRLVIKSWLLLLYIDFVMLFFDFKMLHSSVRDQKISTLERATLPTAAQLCNAIDLACVLYFKQVMCLQRSSATALLLRRYGWHAEMVIGAQIRPFNSHAWVEIDGKVINDAPDMLQIYQVLERC